MGDTVHREILSAMMSKNAALALIRQPWSRTFSFTRRFTILTCICVAVASVASAAYLSWLMAQQTIQHDAEEVMQFVQSFTPAAMAANFFLHSDGLDALSEPMAPLLDRIASMPDVVHVNVYNRQRKVLWSTRPEMRGKVLPINPELEEALNGELAVESSILEDRNYLKPEHMYLNVKDNFVETYVPIWAEDQFQVVGVIEIYRRPTAMFSMIGKLVSGVWLSALAGALLLFASLYWLASRANKTMRQQHNQLVEAERMAVVGEMSAAIAHSIRNPLAAIRSSAELAIEIGPESQRDSANDIVKQADRIARLVNQLLTYSQPASPKLANVELAALLRGLLPSFTTATENNQIAVSTQLPTNLPTIRGDETMMAQILNSLLANAIEAMPNGGTLTVSAAPADNGKHVALRIEDTGSGMSPEQLKRLFIPFNTTKRLGLGLGLPLARRLLQRMNGKIEVTSGVDIGTRVQLRLPTI